MLTLRQVDTRIRTLNQAAAVWRHRGCNVQLEAPPRNGCWLPIKEAALRWQGWLRPGDWLAQVSPELAGLAPLAGFESLVTQWIAATEQPLQMPASELTYQRLHIGELSQADALPEQPMLRLMTAHGPVWLSHVPALEGVQSPIAPLTALRWPLHFVIGESRLSYAWLDRVSHGDLLLINEPRSCLRSHGVTLGHYQVIEEKLKMEWQVDDELQPKGEKMPLRDLNRLPVQLEFILHTRLMTLAELQAACAGELLLLPADAEQHVEVRANGALLGRGELVQVDGRLGVEIAEWLGGDGDVE